MILELFTIAGLLFVMLSLFSGRVYAAIILMVLGTISLSMAISELVGFDAGLIIASLYVSALIIALLIWLIVATPNIPKVDKLSIASIILGLFAFAALFLSTQFVEHLATPKPISRDISFTDYVLLTILILTSLVTSLWFVREGG